MKKIWIALLSITIILCLTGCPKEDEKHSLYPIDHNYELIHFQRGNVGLAPSEILIDEYDAYKELMDSLTFDSFREDKIKEEDFIVYSYLFICLDWHDGTTSFSLDKLEKIGTTLYGWFSYDYKEVVDLGFESKTFIIKIKKAYIGEVENIEVIVINPLLNVNLIHYEQLSTEYDSYLEVIGSFEEYEQLIKSKSFTHFDPQTIEEKDFTNHQYIFYRFTWGDTAMFRIKEAAFAQDKLYIKIECDQGGDYGDAHTDNLFIFKIPKTPLEKENITVLFTSRVYTFNVFFFEKAEPNNQSYEYILRDFKAFKTYLEKNPLVSYHPSYVSDETFEDHVVIAIRFEDKKGQFFWVSKIEENKETVHISLTTSNREPDGKAIDHIILLYVNKELINEANKIKLHFDSNNYD